MSDQIESSRTKHISAFVQSKGVFNAGILLTKTNYDVWFQLIEMHIVE